MIADHETNVVFVADTLKGRFPSVYGGLKSILEHYGIPLRIIPGTKDIWCRDYMPIQVAEDRFVQFRYAPDYLSGKYRHLRTDGEVGLTLPDIKNCVRSEIVLDGGNVVQWDDGVIMTEKIFDENRGWTRRDLTSRLQSLLEFERLILIPTEPGDPIGHADGMVRFMSRDAVAVNDYRSIDRELGWEIRRRMEKARLEVIAIPYRPEQDTLTSIPSASGNYVNFLRIGSLIVLPTFGLDEDVEVRAILQRRSSSPVESLDCRELAKDGGVLNCCTWTMKRLLEQDPTRF